MSYIPPKLYLEAFNCPHCNAYAHQTWWFSLSGRPPGRKTISMFALFGRPLSGGEEVIQGVRLNAGLELPMKPIEYLATMAALDFTASLAHSDVAMPLPLQAVALLLQEDIGQHRQGPEAHDGCRAHHLILVQAQFFLAITEEDLDVPTSGDMGEQRLRIGFKITGGPIACLRERGIQRLAHDHDLAAVEFAHAGAHHMHIHAVLALGPLELAIVAWAQLRCIVGSRFCHRQPWGDVGSSTLSQRLLLSPVVIRNPRSRAACQRHLALYQVSSKTWVWVPATGSKVRMSSFIRSILLAKGTPSASQILFCRYNCGASGQRRPKSTYRLCTKL